MAAMGHGGFGTAASAIPCINSFWDIDTSGTTANSSNCPAIGLNTIQMKTQSTFTDAGWDFSGAWAIDGTETINDGYPYLTGLPAVINSAPDLNILKIEGYADDEELPAFSYVKDGNISIDFNVMDADAGDTLTVDLNYSSENMQGTGTVIVSGLILDATVCDDADFTNSTKCSYDFNIHSTLITDGNYYILALISDATDTDFNASDNNFMIDNTAPEVSISSPADASSQISSTVEIEYSGSDANSGIKNYWVSNDGISWINNSTNLTYEFTSQSGTNTYYVRATDNADNNSSDANVTVTISVPQSSGGNSEQLPEGVIRKQTTVIQKGSSQTLSYSNNDDVIVSIKLIAKNKINSSNLDKKELNELEEENLLIENAFKYIEFTFEDSDNLSEAVIEFRVSKKWLNEMNASRNDVVLMRLIENEWIELKTKLVSGDNDYFYYEAITPGFSYFAISLKEKIIEEPVVEEQEKIESVETETQEPVIESIKEKPVPTASGNILNINLEEENKFNLMDLLIPAIIGIILITLILGGIGFIYLNKKKPEKPKLGFP
jgi:PGF-pre-PGF domain-containing protein